MDRPKYTVVIDDFPGLVSNRGRFPSHPGQALVQTNFRSIREGAIESRLGLRSVTCTSPAIQNTTDLIAVYYLDGSTPKILVEESNGKVRYGSNPT